MSFANLAWLFLLPLALLIPIWQWHKWRHVIAVPSLHNFPKGQQFVWPVYLPLVLRCLAALLLVFALARPQLDLGESLRSSEGLSIMMAIDVSGSMRALDFEIDNQRMDRLAVVKKVVYEFVENRANDRVGMVVFGTEAFTQVPLTIDKKAFLTFMDAVHIAQAGQATAIGDALALSAKRLLQADPKGRVIILLTDGANNAGSIDPLAAADAAAKLKIPVYTIGVATEGKVPFIEEHPMFGKRVVYHESDLDEELLKVIAEKTGGVFYRATDTKGLAAIYNEIDQLEKSKYEIEEHREFEDVFAAFLWPALLLLLIECLLMATPWWRLP